VTIITNSSESGIATTERGKEFKSTVVQEFRVQEWWNVKYLTNGIAKARSAEKG
jgi:hypothetical protein